MKLTQEGAEVFVPDGTAVEAALRRTTHMGIGAHQDDLEMLALEGILACFGADDSWFTGVVVTNGAGSPRDGIYGKYTDEEMQIVRRTEQKKAAWIGEYGAMAFLDHTSSSVKSPQDMGPVSDLRDLMMAARPTVVYTHNPADKHPTHVGVVCKVVQAIRQMPKDARPQYVYGGEVWRDLDWMDDADKVVQKLDAHENIATSLVGVFDSQVAGGKRYDLAVMGRRRAQATYHQSHAVDAARLVGFAMDLTPLAMDDTLTIADHVGAHIDRCRASVLELLNPFG